MTSSSFRAFRFATRYPGGRRGLCFRADVHIRPLHQFPRGTASGSEKRSRDNAMTTPTTSAPSATGRQLQKSQKSIACPKAGQNRRLHRSADPRRAEARTRRSASKRSFLLDRAQPVFFSTRGKRKWGVHPAGPAPCGSRIPVAAGRRPKFPRAVCNLPYTLQGRPYHRAAEGGGPYGCTERIYPRASLRPSR